MKLATPVADAHQRYSYQVLTALEGLSSAHECYVTQHKGRS
jgi:hypothetical protein